MKETLEWVRFYGKVVQTGAILRKGYVALKTDKEGVILGTHEGNVHVDEEKGRVFINKNATMQILGTEEV
jgi:hypothetical protein